MSEQEPDRIELLKFGLRHPIKAIALVLVVAIGMAVTSDVNWTTTMVLVETGQTAQSHQLAEGIA